MNLGRSVTAPRQYRKLLWSRPSAFIKGPVCEIPHERQKINILKNTHRGVMKCFDWRREPRDVWGNGEWVDGRLKGDCDDAAIEEFERLVKMGLPSGAFRYCYARFGNVGHLVLLAATTITTIVLDSRFTRPYSWGFGPWRQYRWRLASEPGEMNWRRIVET